jgi:hypothetical protein
MVPECCMTLLRYDYEALPPIRAPVLPQGGNTKKKMVPESSRLRPPVGNSERVFD